MGLLKRMRAILVIAATVVVLPAEAQVYVPNRPVPPRVVATRRPPRPANSVWIEEDWRVRGERYEYHGGRWATPPRAGMTWRQGRWKTSTRKGYVWVSGRWVSRKYF